MRPMEDTLTTSEVIRIFKESQDLDEIKAAVTRASDRIYATFASVDARDKQGEIIPIQDVINQQEILLERGGPVTDNHTNKVVGRTLAYKVLPSEDTGTLGVLQLNQIFNHHVLDDKVWEETQTGKRTGSSVGGQNLSSSYAMVDGLPTKVLEQFQQFETANVYGPANAYALNQAVSMVAKSDSMSVKPEFFMRIGTDVFKIEKATLTNELPVLNSETIAKSEVTESFIKEQVNEVQKEDSELLVSNDNLLVSSENITKGDTMENTIENIEKSLASLSDDDRALVLAKFSDVSKAKKADEECEKPEEKEEDMEKKKASQPEDKKPEEANDLETLKANVAELSKSMSTMASAVKELAEVSKSSTERPVQSAVAEVSKGHKEALEIAMGKKQTSWSDVNKRYGQ